MRMPHSIPRGFLRHLIVSLLRKKEMTGTEIMDTLEERTGGRWKPSPGSVYPLLASLETEGIIQAASESGRSKRYTLSEEGLQRVKAMFRRKGDLEHKTRLSRALWLNLMEPSDRVYFHLNGMKIAAEFIEELADSLTVSERKKVLVRLGKLTVHIEQLMTKLQTGDSTND